jgi:hypothetical protein
MSRHLRRRKFRGAVIIAPAQVSHDGYRRARCPRRLLAVMREAGVLIK